MHNIMQENKAWVQWQPGTVVTMQSLNTVNIIKRLHNYHYDLYCVDYLMTWNHMKNFIIVFFLYKLLKQVYYYY